MSATRTRRSVAAAGSSIIGRRTTPLGDDQPAALRAVPAAPDPEARDPEEREQQPGAGGSAGAAASTEPLPGDEDRDDDSGGDDNGDGLALVDNLMGTGGRRPAQRGSRRRARQQRFTGPPAKIEVYVPRTVAYQMRDATRPEVTGAERTFGAGPLASALALAAWEICGEHLRMDGIDGKSQGELVDRVREAFTDAAYVIAAPVADDDEPQ